MAYRLAEICILKENGYTMQNEITIYSFGYNDRSSKVRWLAEELDLSINESQLALGEHRKENYRAINPFASVPAVKWGENILTESTATAIYLAEQFPNRKLIVNETESARFDYLQWVSLFTESFEERLVDCILADMGLVDKSARDIFEKSITFKCHVLLKKLPRSGFLVANRFTLADIFACYSIKLAILTGFIRWNDVSGYLEPLIQRPAAKQSRFFESLLKSSNR